MGVAGVPRQLTAPVDMVGVGFQSACGARGLAPDPAGLQHAGVEAAPITAPRYHEPDLFVGELQPVGHELRRLRWLASTGPPEIRGLSKLVRQVGRVEVMPTPFELLRRGSLRSRRAVAARAAAYRLLP